MAAYNSTGLEPFSEKAKGFIESTDKLVHEGVNPGGHYKAVWCRDASYILKDWFLSGKIEYVMQEISFIWSHQIEAGRERIIYGRGSPDMRYLSQVAPRKIQKQFEGALPTTIFRGFSEIYGQNPDIDSTALMVSTTSGILDAYLKSGLVAPSSLPPSYSKEQELKMSSIAFSPSTVMDFVVPKMLWAIDYLAGRDIDDDGLLEQDHNEDWMDTVLRSGKIVYSQACWILALGNLSSLLSELGRENEADRLTALAQKATRAVEQKLWLEEEGTYVDLQEGHHLGGTYRTLTQDVSLYLIAVTENTAKDSQSAQSKGKMRERQEQKSMPESGMRASSTLDALKSRIWKNEWPLVTEAELKTTGPWVLEPNQYHNHTFWPWTTGMEMLARSRFERIDECYALLSTLVSQDAQGKMRALYEWVNPLTGKGDGAFPFRTGISAIRIAIIDILKKRSARRQGQ